MHFSLIIPLLVLFVVVMTQGPTEAPRVLLGPVFQAPRGLDTNIGFLSASSQLSRHLEDVLSSGASPFGSFTRDATSVSISMVSAAQESPLFEFQYTSSLLNVTANGTRKVSGDSIFRIGSISKLLTVYALLLKSGLVHWERPVTDYIPELRHNTGQPRDKDGINRVQWEEVTVGSLASHMSGIGRDYSSSDLSTFPLPWTELGLPQLAAADIPACGGDKVQPPCTRKEYFQGFLKRHPVFSPQSTPIYSNTAFRLLSYVLETTAGDSFENIMERDVFQDLGMTHTSVRKPQDDSLGVIPEGDSMWAFDDGDEAPSGGIYSTSSDLTKLARSILSNTRLSPSVTRRWLKPLAHTSALTLSIGAPWEIWRTKGNTTIELYTKAGGIGLYSSLLILIPDFDIAIAIMTAGPNGSVVNSVAEIVMQIFIPVLKQAARDEAAANFAGHYVSNSGTDSSVVLGVRNGPGLVIEKWLSNGSDLLATAQAYSQATNSGIIGSVRLYPTTLVQESGAGKRVAYRAIFDTVKEAETADRVFEESLNAWAKVDQTMYGRVGVDEFVFDLDASGVAICVEPQFLGIRLTKVL
ncbi:hypothetical protein W97_02121 [Coniosporium apollinis CBS 100218]|uniref:Uncharacterized protein n=1 Tax=Coniosporium apollinis (strain CBS 100218) TaxID=1168221 RepID=R7YMK9_CONA1|nr:uncharacterized protein W97_02121 [Coniosporium apollinis CBS 100218]EON62896.1 hypothetical protein W97_02121 [Coniosporium apollinis CBS 100218]